MKKGKILLLVLLCTVFVCTGCGEGENTKQQTVTVKKESAEIFAMDTIIELTVYAEDPSGILNEARQMIQDYEKLFSVNIETSDVAKLNLAKGASVQVSQETYELIEKSIEMSELTGGIFDISIYPLVRAWGFTTGEYRVPAKEEIQEILKHVAYSGIKLEEDHKVSLDREMQIDLGGIAKGYVSQQLMELFRKKKVTAAVVSLGGNVQTCGRKPDGSPFTVGITDPMDGVSVLGTIQVDEKAVITSGSYQRYFEKDGTVYHHIMDKAIGAPAESDLSSVTVICDNGETADSLATALFVMGKSKAVQFAEDHDGIQLILIDKQNKVWTSEGIEFKE